MVFRRDQMYRVLRAIHCARLVTRLYDTRIGDKSPSDAVNVVPTGTYPNECIRLYHRSPGNATLATRYIPLLNIVTAPTAC